MTLFGDGYAAYVITAYAATALIVGALVWSSVVASRRARRDLDGLARERRR